MIRQGKAWLAAGVLALTAAACFSDPTSSLRKGATRLELSRVALTVRNGDSVAVQAVVLDAQGNSLPVSGVTWSTGDAAVAAVAVDTVRTAPGGAFTRAFVRGTTNQAGITTVTLQANGLTSTLRVLVVPSSFPGVVSVAGTAYGDTITISRPGQSALVIPYTAGDTLVLNATATITFSATASTVSFGPTSGVIISRSTAQIKALARQGFAGRVTVTNLTYAGAAETGPVSIASLQTDSLLIGHARFRPATAPAVTADANFGANTYLTVTAQAGMTFDAGTTVLIGGTPTVGTTANVDGTPLIILTSLAAPTTTIGGIVGSNLIGTVLIKGALLGTVRVDSVRTEAAVTISKSSFPGTVTNGGGALLDTIVVRGNGLARFTTTPAGSVSNVTVNGLTAFVVLRTADSIRVIAKKPGTAAVSINNVIIGTTTIPSLATSSPLVVSTTTGEPNELANGVRATATVLAFTGATDTITVYASLDCEDDGTACPGNGDWRDNFQFTYAGGQKLRAIIEFMGTGNPGPAYDDTNNPDLDVKIRNGAGTSLTSGGTNGAGLLMPEIATTATAMAADTYYIQVDAWVTVAPITYKLRILRTP